MVRLRPSGRSSGAGRGNPEGSAAVVPGVKPVRGAERSAAVVAVTGAGSGLGRALLERLALREDLAGLIGIDPVPARVDGVVWHALDVRDGDLAAGLTGATVVVHLATSYDLTQVGAERRVLNVDGTARLLDAARRAGVRRAVLCTSAELYGARPDNPPALADGAPLRAEPEEGTLAHDLMEVEQLAQDARRRGFCVTVLRPAALVGLAPAYDGQLLRQLSSPRLLAVRGREPQWQLCHVEDLVRALELAVLGAVEGVAAVACEGSLPQAAVEQLTGRRRLEVPASVAFSAAERLRRAGVTDASPRELDHLLGPLVMECDQLRAAGWTPAWTNTDALMAHVAARADSRMPVYTAAGATVALLGTAALVRQARRRRRR